VLVVGAGPSGLVAGITLAGYGIRVLLVEKRSEVGVLPRAVVISTRCMEILRSWGLEEAVTAGAADVAPFARVAHTLTSQEGTVTPLGYPSDERAAEVSPTRPAWAPQDHLEPILLTHLRSKPSVEVQFGTELLSIQQDDVGVTAQLLDRESGKTRRVRVSYVIGADGAHSTVRSELGIEMQGPDALAEFHHVQFRAPLAELIGIHRYGLNVITHPEARGVIIRRGRHDRWGFAREWTPGQPRLADFSTGELQALIASAAGAPDLKPEIDRISEYAFAAQLAERYRARRCFLVGDAAHRTTPRGGTGMNTGIQDGHDLGWKLAWVLRGWAAPNLLDTYERERRPIGEHNVARSSRPDGARQPAEEALPWDLNGRVAHHWIRRGEKQVSTLDLLDRGLTIFACREKARWRQAAQVLTLRAPVRVRVLEDATAEHLGLHPDGALLLRPDGKRLCLWQRVADAEPPAVAERATVTGQETVPTLGVVHEPAS
jgi:putative polyketide hydroxylase